MSKIRWCEDQLRLAYRYLETNERAGLRVFRPLFDQKLDASGNVMPPHTDWVNNVFIRRREKAIARLQKLLRRLEDMEHERRSNRRLRGDRAAPKGPPSR